MRVKPWLLVSRMTAARSAGRCLVRGLLDLPRGHRDRAGSAASILLSLFQNVIVGMRMLWRKCAIVTAVDRLCRLLAWIDLVDRCCLNVLEVSVLACGCDEDILRPEVVAEDGRLGRLHLLLRLVVQNVSMLQNHNINAFLSSSLVFLAGLTR